MSTYRVRLNFAPTFVTVRADDPQGAVEAAFLNYNDGVDELLSVEVLDTVSYEVGA